MTRAAAQAKACRLWGPKAAVKKEKCHRWERGTGVTCSGLGRHHQPCPCGVDLYSVGMIESVVGIRMFSIKGYGATWEAAFAHFEERERKDREEYEARKATNGAAARALNKKLSAAFFGGSHR